MVEKEQIVSMYRSSDEDFRDEIEDLNAVLNEMEINCEVISTVTDDGETLIFKKLEL